MGSAKILLKVMPTPSLSVRQLSIVASGGGGGHWGGGVLGAKILQKTMAPPLSVIKIVKYFGVRGGGGGH